MFRKGQLFINIFGIFSFLRETLRFIPLWFPYLSTLELNIWLKTTYFRLPVIKKQHQRFILHGAFDISWQLSCLRCRPCHWVRSWRWRHNAFPERLLSSARWNIVRRHKYPVWSCYIFTLPHTSTG
jgi:hypothetical protein